MKYQLTGHIETLGNTTAPIRTTIEADSPQEAEDKFKAFLLRKSTPVVTSRLTAAEASQKKMQEAFNGFFASMK